MLTQQHLCQKLLKSVGVCWNYSALHQCRFLRHSALSHVGCVATGEILAGHTIPQTECRPRQRISWFIHEDSHWLTKCADQPGWAAAAFSAVQVLVNRASGSGGVRLSVCLSVLARLNWPTSQFTSRASERESVTWSATGRCMPAERHTARVNKHVIQYNAIQ